MRCDGIRCKRRMSRFFFQTAALRSIVPDITVTATLDQRGSKMTAAQYNIMNLCRYLQYSRHDIISYKLT